MENLVLALAGALVLFLIVRMVLAARGRISSEQAHAEVEGGALLLDVRTEAEFRGGSLPGAKNIPVGSLRARLSELEEGRPIVVFCASGMRSARAASLLRARGFTVHDLGPISAW